MTSDGDGGIPTLELMGAAPDLGIGDRSLRRPRRGRGPEASGEIASQTLLYSQHALDILDLRM
ncbi:hypothetical protein [Streptomyces sp. NPDC050600]|uniref:hypothetical protein n=1 Tax=unclassified Streptomyces TaxID=2593676 RepID=UPI0034391405